MKTAEQRAAKRRKRAERPVKVGTWRCSNCGKRHPNGERCPIPKRGPAADLYRLGGLELGVVAALAAADRMKKR